MIEGKKEKQKKPIHEKITKQGWPNVKTQDHATHEYSSQDPKCR